MNNDGTLSNPMEKVVDPPGTLTVRDGYRRQPLSVGDICWIESFGNYAKVHVGEETMIHRETMASLEARLSGYRFVRVHRTAILNLDRVMEILPGKDGQPVVALSGGTRVRVGRRYKSRIELLGNRQAESENSGSGRVRIVGVGE